MNRPRTGGCLCGRVRFQATGEPLRSFACHCKFCQRVTGSAFYAEAMYPAAAVEFSGVPLSMYSHTSEGSAKQVQVHFCPTCGTTVSLSFERWPEFRGLSRGCFDEPNSLTLSSHIWTCSAQSGVVLPAHTDCFRFARADLQGQPQLPERFDVPMQVSPEPPSGGA